MKQQNNILPNEIVVGPIPTSGQPIYLTFEAKNAEGISLILNREVEDRLVEAVQRNFKNGDVDKLSRHLKLIIPDIKMCFMNAYNKLYDFELSDIQTAPAYLLSKNRPEGAFSSHAVTRDIEHTHGPMSGTYHEPHEHRVSTIFTFRGAVQRYSNENLEAKVIAATDEALQGMQASLTMEEIGNNALNAVKKVLPIDISVHRIDMTVPYHRDENNPDDDHPGLAATFVTKPPPKYLDLVAS